MLEERIVEDRIRATKERCIENYGYVANQTAAMMKTKFYRGIIHAADQFVEKAKKYGLPQPLHYFDAASRHQRSTRTQSKSYYKNSRS